VLSVRESRSVATPFSTGSSAIDPNLLVATTGAGAWRAEAVLLPPTRNSIPPRRVRKRIVYRMEMEVGAAAFSAGAV